jgi:hypothetical protein
MKEPFIGIERRKSAVASPTKRIEPPQFFTPTIFYPLLIFRKNERALCGVHRRKSADASRIKPIE